MHVIFTRKEVLGSFPDDLSESFVAYNKICHCVSMKWATAASSETLEILELDIQIFNQCQKLSTLD
jgi:hypothetical protein